MLPKAILLDLYGTLLHLENETKPYHKLFIEHCRSIEEVKIARRICLTENLPDMRAVTKRLFPNTQINTSAYEQEINDEVNSAKLYRDSLETLKKLAEKNVKLCLISNLGTPYKKPFYALKLSDYITTTVFSCDEGTLKPEQKIYQIALEKLQIKPHEALMTGDKMANDVKGPNSMGIRAILLDRTNNSDHTPRIQTLLELLNY